MAGLVATSEMAASSWLLGLVRLPVIMVAIMRTIAAKASNTYLMEKSMVAEDGRLK